MPVKTSRLLPGNTDKVRVEIDHAGVAWSVPAQVEPFATILRRSQRDSLVSLPLADSFVHRLLIRLEREGIANREA